MLATQILTQFKSLAMRLRPQLLEQAKDDRNWRPGGILHTVGQESYNDRQLMVHVVRAAYPRTPTVSDEAFAYWAVERLLNEKRAAKEETAEKQAQLFYTKVAELRANDSPAPHNENESALPVAAPMLGALNLNEAIRNLHHNQLFRRRARDNSDDDDDNTASSAQRPRLATIADDPSV
jgi:hypothetical protein